MADDYHVWTVSESRHPEAFTALWSTATEEEQRTGSMHRWATLVPVHDPAFGIADLVVEFDGRAACYLRPPHIGQVASLLAAANAATAEVPAVIERGPAGPTVRLLLPS